MPQNTNVFNPYAVDRNIVSDRLKQAQTRLNNQQAAASELKQIQTKALEEKLVEIHDAVKVSHPDLLPMFDLQLRANPTKPDVAYKWLHDTIKEKQDQVKQQEQVKATTDIFAPEPVAGKGPSQFSPQQIDQQFSLRENLNRLESPEEVRDTMKQLSTDTQRKEQRFVIDKNLVGPYGHVYYTGNGSDLSRDEKIKLEDNYRKEFESSKTVDEYNLVLKQWGIMDAAMEQAGLIGDPSKKATSFIAADEALITVFKKMLDPHSVVRESEYSRTPESQARIDKIVGWFQKQKFGGPGLTAQNRRDIHRMGLELLEVYRDDYRQAVAFYTTLAKKRGLDPSFVIRNRSISGRSGTPASANTGDTKPPLSSYHTK